MSAAPDDILDVAIAGGGPAGLTLALALKRELGPSLRVAVFDPALGRRSSDARASMIAADGRKLLQRLDAWPDRAAPIAALRITDSRLDDAIRPTFLDLAGQAADEPFAHMAPDAELRAGLRARAEQAGVSLIADAIVDHKADPGRVRIALPSGAARQARLLVAADGARSPTRARAGVAVHAFDYDQTALVATIGHSEPHRGVAVQHFLPAGPFAILPLDEHRSSLVWSERRAAADAMIAADDETFLSEVSRRAGPDFGTLSLAGPRGHFPLRFMLATRFVAPRLALVGDAGHVVHPLAGQGFNVGLRDIMALARIIADAARAGEDFGAPSVLDGYERARRFDVAALAAATDGLYRLFARPAARSLRDVGMGLVDRAPGLKRRIVDAASGA